jgi:hypothetical protein
LIKVKYFAIQKIRRKLIWVSLIKKLGFIINFLKVWEIQFLILQLKYAIQKMSQSYFDKRNQPHSFFILSPNYLAIIIMRCLRTILFICLNSTYFLLCIYLKIKLRFFSLIVLRNSCAKPSNLFPSPQFDILLFFIIIL